MDESTHAFLDSPGSRRVAVFCLLQMDSEVFDTQMMVVDRSVTDICFEGTFILYVTVYKSVLPIRSAINCIFLCSKGAVPEFELRVALWSCAVEDDPTLVNTPKKLARKLRNSLGRSAGMQHCPLLDTPDPDTFLRHNPVPVYVRRHRQIEPPRQGVKPESVQEPSEHYCVFTENSLLTLNEHS